MELVTNSAGWALLPFWRRPAIRITRRRPRPRGDARGDGDALALKAIEERRGIEVRARHGERRGRFDFSDRCLRVPQSRQVRGFRRVARSLGRMRRPTPLAFTDGVRPSAGVAHVASARGSPRPHVGRRRRDTPGILIRRRVRYPLKCRRSSRALIKFHQGRRSSSRSAAPSPSLVIGRARRWPDS
jgi:hypothetical protein